MTFSVVKRKRYLKCHELFWKGSSNNEVSKNKEKKHKTYAEREPHNFLQDLHSKSNSAAILRSPRKSAHDFELKSFHLPLQILGDLYAPDFKI